MTLVGMVMIFLGFVVVRRQILKSYTRKIPKILNEMTKESFWEVSELWMSLKLNELNQNYSRKN